LAIVRTDPFTRPFTRRSATVAFSFNSGYGRSVFTAVFQKSGEWWAAYVEEVPGVNSQGATLDEARENLREALTMVLDANRELARREEPPGCIRENIALIE
jgi:predicted RNase H-like HicB family nuclease